MNAIGAPKRGKKSLLVNVPLVWRMCHLTKTPSWPPDNKKEPEGVKVKALTWWGCQCKIWVGALLASPLSPGKGNWGLSWVIDLSNSYGHKWILPLTDSVVTIYSFKGSMIDKLWRSSETHFWIGEKVLSWYKWTKFNFLPDKPIKVSWLECNVNKGLVWPIALRVWELCDQLTLKMTVLIVGDRSLPSLVLLRLANLFKATNKVKFELDLTECKIECVTGLSNLTKRIQDKDKASHNFK